MDELRQKFIRNNYKTLKSINDSVSIISINNKKYILKEFSVPLKNKQINQQHDFIHFLLSKGLTTPSIVLSIKKENKNYEIQEYIERLSNDYNIEDIVAYISKFHNASFKYKKELSKSAVYNYEFECKNFTLGTLLLGFEQKYYIYPKKNLLDNYNLLSYTNHKYVDDVLKIYDDCYHYFIQNYSIKDCIIHNDITPNNIINSKELYIIDFDLSIKSSVYVDFVDCIIGRYNSIRDLNANEKNVRELINNCIKIYNQYSENIELKIDAVICMTILKIISFNFYVLLNKKNYNKFNKNFGELYVFIKKMYNSFKEVI